VADRDVLILQPDPDGEVAGSIPQDGVGAVMGAVERRDDATVAQPDKWGLQQLASQLGQQLETGIVSEQRKSRSIQGF
jgi:hypothetical protein